MKQKKKLLLCSLALALLLAGTSVLYARLGTGAAPDRLTVLGGETSQKDLSDAPAAQEGGTEAPDHVSAPEEDTALPKEETAPSEEKTETEERKEPKAPDFTVFDENGAPIRLSNYFGKPIVLNFWAGWCGPCQSEMPDFHESYLALGGEVEFMMVNLTYGRETKTGAKNFINEKGYTFPVYFDTESNASNAYSVYSIPTTFFIDAEGYLVATATGAIDAQTLSRGIELIR